MLESVRLRTSSVAEPFAIGACKDDADAEVDQDALEPEDKSEVTRKRKGMIKQKLKTSKTKKKERKARRVQRASSRPCRLAAPTSVQADAPKPASSSLKKSDVAARHGPNYEPLKYMAAYKEFLAAKKLEGMNRNEALEGWHSSDIKKRFLEGMSFAEMKRRRFIKG